GNVNGDRHKELVFINGELKELDVFKEMVKIGVLSIMVGHIAIEKNGKYNPVGFPSTLSRKIVTDLLKNELGFKGLIITDAMNMEAVTKFPSPSLKAIEAGCDMVLMPSDEAKLINTVKEKMDKDPVFMKQIYESVRKIIRVKLSISNFK
ncbi:MAG: glycoside hydrolase family 3 N-terminal domain-containing protein, partial [Ignavibacteria bacterium]